MHFTLDRFAQEIVSRVVLSKFHVVLVQTATYSARAITVAAALVRDTHANIRTATRNWSFSALDFKDKNIMTCASAMPYRRDFPRPLPGSRHFKLEKA